MPKQYRFRKAAEAPPPCYAAGVMVLQALAASCGWVALALAATAAAAGPLLRRFVRGRFIVRMRPHYVLGYGALAVACVHTWHAMGGMTGAGALGIKCATLALLGLVVQAFVGASLQSPGAYRAVLRRWHLATMAVVLTLATVHAAVNGPLAPAFTAVAMLR